MITLGWNCQGLGNPQTVRVLCEFVQRWDPKIFCLTETKLNKKTMRKEKEKVGFTNSLIIPSLGRSGGLALLWKKDIVVEVQGDCH